MRFNENLKELREERGITRQEMAKYLGITLQAYSNYEKVSEPRYATLEKIADLFNVSIDRLMGYKPNKLKGCLKLFHKHFDCGSYVKPDTEDDDYLEVFLCVDYISGRLSMRKDIFIDMCETAELDKQPFSQVFYDRFFKEYGIAMGQKHKAECVPMYELPYIEEPEFDQEPPANDGDFSEFGIVLDK